MSASASYHKTEGKVDVTDEETGTKIDHVKAVQEYKDPAQGLRDKIAVRVASHVKDIECPTCVDVGCSIGNDCKGLLAALGRQAKVTGVDIMEGQLEKARQLVPGVTFLQGEATKLPLGDASVDSLQCARLLMHCEDLPAALNEFLRVMKPGALGVFYEGDFRAQHLLTSDATIAKVHAAKQAMSTGSVAQPHVAQEVLKLSLASPHAESVTFDGFPAVHRDPTYGYEPMREMEKGQLAKMVEKGTLTQAEVDEYYERLDAAVERGDWVEAGLVFEIGFVKKA